MFKLEEKHCSPYVFDQLANVFHANWKGMHRALPMMGSEGGLGGSFFADEAKCTCFAKTIAAITMNDTTTFDIVMGRSDEAAFGIENALAEQVHDRDPCHYVYIRIFH